jgi:hypothetical protein
MLHVRTNKEIGPLSGTVSTDVLMGGGVEVRKSTELVPLQECYIGLKSAVHMFNQPHSLLKTQFHPSMASDKWNEILSFAKPISLGSTRSIMDRPQLYVQMILAEKWTSRLN